MSESKYEVIIYWDKDDAIFVAVVPELPGCQAHGATKAEAIHHAEEAIALWLSTAKEDGIEVLEPQGRLLRA